MGEITDKNTKELEQACCYGQADLSDMLDNCFAEEFDKLIMSKGFSTQYIVQNSRISKTYLNELRRRLPTGKSKHISREMLIEVVSKKLIHFSNVQVISLCIQEIELTALSSGDCSIK